MTDLKELERLAGECSPLPWEWEREEFGAVWYEVMCKAGYPVFSDGSACGEYNPDIDPHGPDAAYITAACNALPALLELVREQHEALEAMTNDGSWVGGMWLNSEEADEKARAALAKYSDMMEKGDD